MDTTCRPRRSFLARSNDDRVLRLLLRVARRADELARLSPSGGSARRDRETWGRAEGELLPSLGTTVRAAVVRHHVAVAG